MADILKLNYDDFYKFLVSAGIILTLVSTAASAFSFLNFGDKWVGLVFGICYLIIAGAGVAGIIYGLIKWHKKQEQLDKEQPLKLHMMGLELENKKAELRNKELESESRKLEIEIRKLEMEEFRLKIPKIAASKKEGEEII